MKKLLSFAIYGTLIVAGAGLVFVADRQGWFANDQSSVPPPIVDPDQGGSPAAARIIEPVRLVSAGEYLPRLLRAPAVACATQEKIIQFASDEVARKAGLQTMRAERRAVSKSLECN